MEAASDLQYMTGFGNHFESEARAGALPKGQNSPQRAPLGLYAEKFSAEAFTVPRAANARSWLYRIRPSIVHGKFTELDAGNIRSAPAHEIVVPPDPLRWKPQPLPKAASDFIDGLVTIACSGNVMAQQGMAVHIYRANRSMEERYFCNADGELLLVPELGGLRL
ncbi:MAG: homogentisate 1,2-dioxygenase, partial [Halioglobus sp.]|nr:homogentisate 1,2-dioxygenase [Halioglobus sp.]